MNLNRPQLLIALLAIVAPRIAGAQTGPETIRGKITDDSSRAVVASISVTRGPDRLTQQTTSDSSGNYSTVFQQGTGDYLVYVSAPGFKPARRRVQREGNETVLVANFQLAREVTTLDAVRVSANRPVRASNNITPTQQNEPGSSEKWNDGVSGAVSPTIAGDLNALAGTMPNVTMGPGGASILGSGSESNLNTLNGMGMSAAAIPRAARTETRVTGATFDPTRGGFAGANIDVRLGPGSRNFQRRNAFVTLDPQAWQFSDAIGRALGAPSGGVRASFGADGELIRRALTYNVAMDVAKSSSEPATLLSANADALRLAGVSPDSVARLIAISTPLGLPVAASGVPGARQHSGVAWLGRLDITTDTMKTRALTSYLGFTRDGAIGFGPLAAPSSSGERRERTLGAQLTLGKFVGPGQRVLTETRVAASAVKTEVAPYQYVPGASVLVRSTTSDGPDVTALTLGGGSFLSTDDSRWTAEGSNETIWNARGRRHRFKTLLWGRADGLEQQGIANSLGTFAFNSIDDFEAGHPASFSRTLLQPDRSGKVWNAATAFAHQYSPSRFFSLLYGARIEADGFLDKPDVNPALEQVLGVTTGAAPSRFHVSPRLGFTYTYNRDKDNGNGTNQSPVGRFYRTTVGVLRGGIGEFRDLLRPGILADASAATGLAGGTSTLSCVGEAVPVVDWTRFTGNPDEIPDACRDGSGPLVERASQVTLIDPSYDVPRSWRASLDLSTNLPKQLLLRVGGLFSYDLSQPGTIDENFSGITKATLASENNRPMFVSPLGVDPSSGAVSATESRISSQFGRVGSRVSDLRGYGGQFTVGLSPDVFKFRTRFSFYSSLGYTLQWTRRQFRGFDGAGFGDPRLKEWAPNATDARHVIVFTGGVSHKNTGTITLFSRFQSGLPYTALVQGDVNGDGRGGDRAFIPDPAASPDAQLASQMQSLIASSSGNAKECLIANLGRIAPRNGCRGPWTQSLNLQWRPPLPRKWLGRVSPTVYLQNMLAGVDQAFHGKSLHGWGSQATPEATLLIPRGFNRQDPRFTYDVNPRFGKTSTGRTIARDPFRIVIDFSINLSTDFDLQQLRRAVEPVKVKNTKVWERRSADSLASFYLANTSSIHKILLSESDSLFLTKSQQQALRSADSLYSERVRAIYRPLGEFLAQSNGTAGKVELDSVQKTQKKYWEIFWEQPEIAGAIVTPAQRELMPMFARILQVPMEDRKNSQWQFGHPVTFADKPKQTP
jgi:hypothetical protein